MAINTTAELAELLTKLFDRPFTNLVMQDSYIYKWLPKAGMKDTEILFKVHYAGNDSAGSYGEGDDLGEAGVQAYKPAKVGVRMYKAKVALSGLMIEAAKGAGGYRDAWTSEVNDGLEDLKTNMSDDLLVATTPGNGGKDHDGIPYIVADTGTYANIDSDTFTWWQSYVNDNASDRNLTIALMQDVHKNVRLRPRGGRPSIIFCDLDQFNNFGNLLTPLRRYQPAAKLAAGFDDDALDFNGIPVKFVDGYPAQRMDFLDKRSWQYRTLLNFKSEPLDAGNVDARELYFKHYGLVVCKKRNQQGSLQDLNIVPA